MANGSEAIHVSQVEGPLRRESPGAAFHLIQTFGRGASNVRNGSITIPRSWYQTPNFDG